MAERLNVVMQLVFGWLYIVGANSRAETKYKKSCESLPLERKLEEDHKEKTGSKSMLKSSFMSGHSVLKTFKSWKGGMTD